MNKKERLKYLYCFVYLKYATKMAIVFKDGLAEDDFGSYIKERIVEVPKCTILNPDEWSLFAFLHEIGHIMTNNTKMKRCEQEYLATKWAIKESTEIGFKVPKKYITVYQNYIWEWRDRGIKCGAKKIPSREQLTLSF